MSYSVYEFINTDQSSAVNAFAASIQNSTFHWHNEYELIGVLRGEITELAESEVITLRAGDMLLVNPNVIHAIKSTGEGDNLCMIIQIRQELFAMEENSPGCIHFYLNSTGDEEPECGYEKIFRRMAAVVYETMNDERHAAFRARAEAYCLIADLFDYVVYDVRYRDNAVRDSQQLIISVIDYMERHLEEEKIADLACHEFGISRKTLDRSLKTTLGSTGKEILDILRIEKAKSLLKNTDKNMNYILDACGFGSEKTFYRVFRQGTGLTPKEFREKGQYIDYNEALKGYLDVESFEVRTILEKIVQKI